MDRLIRRGDVYYADLDPSVGREQGGRRPVLVIQNDTGNRHGATVIVAPVTSRSRLPFPTHVLLAEQDGLREGSTVLLEQVRTIDKSRLGAKVCSVGPAQMSAVDAALTVSLGIKGTFQDYMLLSLCRSCVKSFRDSPGYLVMRADFDQESQERCMMCGVRRGYDYKIVRR